MAAADSYLGSLLPEKSIRLNQRAFDKFDAVRQTGQALVESGAADENYIEAMLEREHSVSTFVGEGVAIPHGTLAGKDSVTANALSVLRFPGGVDWDGNHVTICVGIAATSGGHIALLSQLAEVLLDTDRAARLRNATTADEVYELLTPPDDEG
jgi:PTS system mannitol-specific IIA component